ncbi:PQQ-binding-like beta-propeller repeat protein [Leptolyngbya sp. AN02str]|uniref:PQQ-binding-like beta-propeller repeat protein n=1 Tax=Leptolyngbya sp. AN02str TaxID=3423363 RepID=UPI003D31C645
MASTFITTQTVLAQAPRWFTLLSLLCATGCGPISRASVPFHPKELQTIYAHTASSAPAIAHNTLYFGGETEEFVPTLFAVDQDTGQIRWQFSLSGAGEVSHIPTIANGILYVGVIHHSDPAIYALNAQTGQLQWQIPVASNVLSPVIVGDGMAYFRELHGYLRARDASTGEQRWMFPAEGSLKLSRNGEALHERSQEVMSNPAVAEGLVYVGTRTGLEALDAKTGKRVWRFATQNWVETAPLLHNGRVYIGSGSDDRSQGFLYGLSAKTGALEWDYAIAGGIVDSELAIAHGLIFFGGNSPHLHAVELATQQEKWRFPTRISTHDAVPFVQGDSVVFAVEEVVYALDAQTGTLRWSYKECLNCNGYTPHIQGPTLDNGSLYYLLRDKIYQFQADDP